MRRRRVLFLCTHNAARSQMAEGFLRALGGDRFEAASAGGAAGFGDTCHVDHHAVCHTK